MQPLELESIGTARLLVRSGGAGGPGRAEPRRAVGTACYAVFHALCRNCADRPIGKSGADRNSAAWLQAYRAVERKPARDRYGKKKIVSEFPQAIQDFAEDFTTFQKDRHMADCNPAPHFDLDRRMVEAKIDRAEKAIEKFRRVAVKRCRAFAAWALVKNGTD